MCVRDVHSPHTPLTSSSRDPSGVIGRGGHCSMPNAISRRLHSLGQRRRSGPLCVGRPIACSYLLVEVAQRAQQSIGVGRASFISARGHAEPGHKTQHANKKEVTGASEPKIFKLVNVFRRAALRLRACSVLWPQPERQLQASSQPVSIVA